MTQPAQPAQPTETIEPQEIDFRMASVAEDDAQYEELIKAFPSDEERNIVVRAVNKPMPSPLVYAFAVAKEKMIAIFSKKTDGAKNGDKNGAKEDTKTSG